MMSIIFLMVAGTVLSLNASQAITLTDDYKIVTSTITKAINTTEWQIESREENANSNYHNDKDSYDYDDYNDFSHQQSTMAKTNWVTPAHCKAYGGGVSNFGTKSGPMTTR